VLTWSIDCKSDLTDGQSGQAGGVPRTAICGFQQTLVSETKPSARFNALTGASGQPPSLPVSPTPVAVWCCFPASTWPCVNPAWPKDQQQQQEEAAAAVVQQQQCGRGAAVPCVAAMYSSTSREWCCRHSVMLSISKYAAQRWAVLRSFTVHRRLLFNRLGDFGCNNTCQHAEAM